MVKWVGGKTQLLPELVARMPARFGRYYEPFVGGAALFFRVAPARAVLGDANEALIATYRAITADIGAVIARLREHGAEHSERHYDTTKRQWNTPTPQWIGVGRAAAFIYLNKAGFNGLYRVNRLGEFNVGWGKHPTYDPDVDNLRAAACVLARAELRAGDFRKTLHDAALGDFAYMDPIYDDTFASYTATKHGRGADHQAEYAYEVRKLVDRGVQVMVSNADTPRIRALYAGMRIDVVQAARAVNCDGAGRGKVDEVIITAGYTPSDAAIARLAADRTAGKPKNKRKRGGAA